MEMDESAIDDFTSDAFLEGRVRVRQHRRGYRFSIDSILLAHHAAARGAETILDLGAGCGIISLLLAYRNPKAKILGIEIQRELADIARYNVLQNHMADRIEIRRGDFKTLTHSDLFEAWRKFGCDPETRAGVPPVDLVVSNPPYRRVRSGRMNLDSRRAVARHEVSATLKDVVGAAQKALEISGGLVMVHLAERLTDLLWEMRSAGIEPKMLRMIHPREEESANRVLVEGKKGGRPGLTVGPPLVIYGSEGGSDGEYTDEVNRMFLP